MVSAAPLSSLPAVVYWQSRHMVQSEGVPCYTTCVYSNLALPPGVEVLYRMCRVELPVR